MIIKILGSDQEMQMDAKTNGLILMKNRKFIYQNISPQNTITLH